LKPPPGLSARSRRVWKALHADFSFTVDSVAVLQRALEAYDLSDHLLGLARAAGLDSKEARGLLASSRDASAVALKHWQALRLDRADPDAVRRPGRPSGDRWSPKRAEGARAWRSMMATAGGAKA
jgi:hypothetical protein